MGVRTRRNEPRYNLSAYCELDKAGGAWFVTGWLDQQPRTAVRLKIVKECGFGDPFDVYCELRRPGRTEFETVAFLESVDQFDIVDSCLCEVPTEWRGVFFTMLRHVSHLLAIIDLAGEGERYAAEPLSSRDYLIFGAADDMPPRH